MTTESLPPELEHSHSPDAIRARLQNDPEHSYLRDFIYGAVDGAVTTFAVVSGVAGAGLAPNIVIVLGVANLIGDGFSMAAGNYLGTKAEAEQREKTRLMEHRHIAHSPDGEREEIRQIYAAYGFEGALLEQIVTVITSDKNRWVNTMLREEFGLSSISPNPFKSAAATFIAFILIGAIPLLPFVANLLIPFSGTYLISTLMTGIAFFAVGAAKSKFVEQHWAIAGAETLIVGAIASGFAYLCGWVLQGIVA
ncbi:MAG: VIT1/CCC1 transporter family protein [Planctomycetaceae bacterium]|nr:VIT1/CCC1 transporter family protein [Planctomycetaceae bacterium]MCA9043231.1 VIT1/CCC1 transporter family protein [Planctomycetaceae bacterium]